MPKQRRPTSERLRVAYVFPVWLHRAVKFDATKQGIPASRFVEAIVARNISPESRRQASAPDPEPAATA